jgi:hypothetical protein
MRDLGALRTPLVPVGKGLYESLYLTATDVDGKRALWLRHTWLKRPGQAPEPTLWVTWWGPELSQTRAPGTAELTASGSRGIVEDHSWDLSWQANGPQVPYLPAMLYDRWFPRSNGVALVPHGTVSGVFDGHDLTGWSAVVGHNWGAEHAHEWEWLHGASGDDWFDQLRVKPFPHSPWLTVATTHIQGKTKRARKPLSTQIVNGVEVTWDYPSPTGKSKKVRNCSVATAVIDGRTYKATVEYGA